MLAEHYNAVTRFVPGKEAASWPMDGFDVVLLIVVVYVAIMSLVRLMLARRDRLIRDLHKQLDAQMRVRNASSDSKTNKAA